MAPAPLVRRERPCAACEWDLIEAGFGKSQHDAIYDFFQLKADEGGGFGRVVDVRVNRARMPSKREEPFRLHPVDCDFLKARPS